MTTSAKGAGEGRPHSFHIPVMGTGFTIDTPLRVARYGVSSVVSIVDDRLIERMRLFHAREAGEACEPITDNDPDARSRRITAYLDLLSRLVDAQCARMRSESFGAGSDLTRYYELMDDACALKAEYGRMVALEDGPERREIERRLRAAVRPGAIDVNIMTKVDAERTGKGEFSDALAALRGFALSTLESSVVLSAGLNLPLFSYLETFDDFFPRGGSPPRKRVILKVSDFRSAFTQAKVLAKKGLWVSEFRIESGLNCGGHAFATAGHLLGPVLEEFLARKDEFLRTVHPVYREALQAKRPGSEPEPPAMCVSAQGGVGTSAETRFLLRRYGLVSVGWGSPFLLVPEATTVDDDTLAKLARAGEGDIYLSEASPLGVPFFNLRNSASEEARRERIRLGRPGSPCLYRYLAFNTEFGEALCTASARYQRLKVDQLKETLGEGEAFEHAREKVYEKSCICRDLGSGALIKNGLGVDEKRFPAVCPGPNLVFFKRIASLREMVDHIYGRSDLLDGISRPHVFLNELRLYIDHLKRRVREALSPAGKERAYLEEFKENLLAGARYYRGLAEQLAEETPAAVRRFLSELGALEGELLEIAVS